MKTNYKILFTSVSIALFLVIFITERKKHDRIFADEEQLSVPSKPKISSLPQLRFAWIGTTVSRTQFAKYIHQGFSEDRALEVFGKNKVMDSSEVDGKTVRTYHYCYTPQVVEQLKTANPMNYQIGFSLVFQDGVLTEAEEVRNISQNVYLPPDEVRQLLVPDDTDDSVEKKFGYPRSSCVRGENFIFTYYFWPEISRNFPSDYFGVQVVAIFSGRHLIKVDYNFKKIDFTEQKGKFFLRHTEQIHHCIMPNMVAAMKDEEPMESLLPLEQFGITDCNQLNQRKNEIIKICKPLLEAFTPPEDP